MVRLLLLNRVLVVNIEFFCIYFRKLVHSIGGGVGGWGGGADCWEHDMCPVLQSSKLI